MEVGQVDVSLVDSIIDLYSFEAPLPGFSLGPRALPNAGTLTGYVKHSSGGENQVFALTCQHVVTDRKLHPSLYLHQDGQPKDFITSPALKDHIKTAQWISGKIKEMQLDIDVCTDRLANDLTLSTKAREVLEGQKGVAIGGRRNWETVKLQADNYDTHLGYLKATSAFDNNNPSSNWKGILDWALISVPAHKQTQNRVCLLRHCLTITLLIKA